MKFSERLEILLDEAKNVSDFARRSGVSEATIRGYLQRGSIPNIEKAASIASAANVRIEWLATGNGPMRMNAEQSEIAKWEDRNLPATLGNVGYEPSKYVGISYHPNYADAFSGTGGDSDIRLEDSEPMVFKRNWITETLKRKPADLLAVTVSGDSMEPTIRDGDLVLVDTTETDQTGRLLDGKIYVLRYSGMLRIKRIQYAPGNNMRLISDNDTYPPMFVEANKYSQEEFSVVGRVIWYARGI